MSLTNPEKTVNHASITNAGRELNELVSNQPEWFISEDGRGPVEVNRTEFDFSVAHGRLIFSCWTEQGSRAWRITAWNWSGDKLSLQTSRRMGAEVTTIALVPRASAKALVASIAAARQARCERLAHLVAQTSVRDLRRWNHGLRSGPRFVRVFHSGPDGLPRSQPQWL